LRNVYLSDRTAADIDARVARVLKGLGNPRPPLRLELVRDLHRLDRKFFSSGDPSAAQEFVHKMKMAGKQLALRPALIWDVIKKWDLRALYLHDRKRILIDANLPEIKQRWGEAHEIGHSLMDWHEVLALGDDQQSLSPSCHAKLEAEANYAAARLLFLQDHFVEELRDTEPSLVLVRDLSKTFGNSMTTTLWCVVENMGIPAFGVVCDHPRRPGEKFDAAAPCRYFIRSRTFERQFGNLGEVQVFAALLTYCGYQGGGPLGSNEVVFRDDNGVDHVFFLETFYNSHDALTFGLRRGPRPKVVTVA
jgi:hypothetical protein